MTPSAPGTLVILVRNDECKRRIPFAGLGGIAELPEDDEAAQPETASASPPSPKTRFKTAMRSKSSGFNREAFLMSRCFAFVWAFLICFAATLIFFSMSCTRLASCIWSSMSRRGRSTRGRPDPAFDFALPFGAACGAPSTAAAGAGTADGSISSDSIGNTATKTRNNAKLLW